MKHLLRALALASHSSLLTLAATTAETGTGASFKGPVGLQLYTSPRRTRPRPSRRPRTWASSPSRPPAPTICRRRNSKPASPSTASSRSAATCPTTAGSPSRRRCSPRPRPSACNTRAARGLRTRPRSAKSRRATPSPSSTRPANSVRWSCPPAVPASPCLGAAPLPAARGAATSGTPTDTAWPTASWNTAAPCGTGGGVGCPSMVIPSSLALVQSSCSAWPGTRSCAKNTLSGPHTAQNFVLMPQARNAHQPRRASKATKKPDASRTMPSQADTVKPKPAPTSNAIAATPRTSRPLLSMFREKNGFIVSLSWRVCAGRRESRTGP